MWWCGYIYIYILMVCACGGEEGVTEGYWLCSLQVAVGLPHTFSPSLVCVGLSMHRRDIHGRESDL